MKIVHCITFDWVIYSSPVFNRIEKIENKFVLQRFPDIAQKSDWNHSWSKHSLPCIINSIAAHVTALLPDTENCGLRLRRECRYCFPNHWLQMKPLVSDPGMHHSTCVTHVPWYMSVSLTHSEENVPAIPGACATRNFVHLGRQVSEALAAMVFGPALPLVQHQPP